MIGYPAIEVGIRVEAEDILTGIRRHTTSCYFAMVALDENGNAITVPQFEPVTELDRKRWDEAEQRRAVRLADRSADR